MILTEEHKTEIALIRQKYDKSKPNDTEKMFTFIRGFCSDKHNPKPETMRALGYARRKHHGQFRDNGEPYIVHPLSMANFAIGLGLTDDNLLAVILLHDICEDTFTSFSYVSHSSPRRVMRLSIKPATHVTSFLRQS